MADKPWKQFEREMGDLIGGSRFWANSGESVDCEGPVFLAQCKHVKSMSLNALAELAEQAEHDGRKRVKRRTVPMTEPLSEGKPMPPWIEKVSDPRIGIVGIKTRPGRGKKSTTLVVMTRASFKQLFPTHKE